MKKKQDIPQIEKKEFWQEPDSFSLEKATPVRGPMSSTSRMPFFGRPVPAASETKVVPIAKSEGKILVADDDPDMQKFYDHILTARGYEVSIASNGQSALDMIKRQNFDLLVTDLAMPVMDGRSLILALKKAKPKLPVIIASNRDGMRHDPELRLATQVHTFLSKPFKPTVLINTVQQIIGCHQNSQKTRRISDASFVPKESKSSEPGSFQGQIDYIGLIPLLQMLGIENKTGGLILQKEEQKGYIFVESGQVVHSSMDNLSGEEAFFSLLAWRKGYFQFIPRLAPPVKNIGAPIEYLLLEGARRMDEQQSEDVFNA